eukprot:TRINITY_DN19378_c0_g1_i1.p1 TRINITY_DN19378_c0_g1~~TRINITY_DN19378_c0_g1_i1.p1  ORF type:complete len:248 (+),score=41.24 TRINITY_DN19378_c0_g1_i1:78-821(+)
MDTVPSDMHATITVNLQQAQNLMYTDPIEADTFAIKAHDLVDRDQPDQLELLSDILQVRGFINRKQRLYEKALPFYEESVKICEQLHPDGLELARAYKQTAISHNLLDNHDAALDQNEKSLRLLEKIFPEAEETATAYDFHGTILDNMGLTEQAIEWTLRGAKMKQITAPHTISRAHTCGNAAERLWKLGRHEEALEYNKTEEEIRNATQKGTPPMKRCYRQAMQLHSALGNSAKAEEYAALLTALD